MDITTAEVVGARRRLAMAMVSAASRCSGIAPVEREGRVRGGGGGR